MIDEGYRNNLFREKQIQEIKNNTVNEVKNKGDELINIFQQNNDVFDCPGKKKLYL